MNLDIKTLVLIGLSLSSCFQSVQAPSISSVISGIYLDYQVDFEVFKNSDRAFAPLDMTYRVKLLNQTTDTIKYEDSLDFGLLVDNRQVNTNWINRNKNTLLPKGQSVAVFVHPYDQYDCFSNTLNSSDFDYLTKKIKQLKFYIKSGERDGDIELLTTDNLKIQYIFSDTLVTN